MDRIGYGTDVFKALHQTADLINNVAAFKKE